jgi:hypothetical protein
VKTLEQIAREMSAEKQRILDGVVEVLAAGPNYSRGIVDALKLPMRRGDGPSQRSIRLVAEALRDLEARGMARSWVVLPEGRGMQRRYYELVDGEAKR